MAIRGRLVKPNVVAAFVGILGVISLVYVYGTRLHYPPTGSDGVGYYLYLPAAVILTASLILVCLSAWMMLKYWMHDIPFDGTTWPQFVSALPLAS
jgi:hypothetical protein